MRDHHVKRSGREREKGPKKKRGERMKILGGRSKIQIEKGKEKKEEEEEE